jgi:lysophospholipase L1-like esterase
MGVVSAQIRPPATATLTRRTLLASSAVGLLALAGCAATEVRAPLVRERVQVTARPPLPAGSVVAFYGDSITSGSGASSPSRRWSTLLCAQREWVEVNPSVPGIGFVQSRGDTDLPATIVDAHPDAILVTLGLDDQLLVDTIPDRVRAAISNDLHELRSGAPDAHILVALPITVYERQPSQLVTLQRWLRTSAAAVSAPVIESAGWMRGRTELTIDGTHFNDDGQRRIARLMDLAIQSALEEPAVRP